MLELVQTFLKTIKEREHVLQLINSNEFIVCIVSGAKRVQAAFDHGEVYMVSQPHSNLAVYEINGSLEALERLLKGKEKLRLLIGKNQLKVIAPFRVILLLESIFYLTKSDVNIRKII